MKRRSLGARFRVMDQVAGVVEVADRIAAEVEVGVAVGAVAAGKAFSQIAIDQTAAMAPSAMERSGSARGASRSGRLAMAPTTTTRTRFRRPARHPPIPPLLIRPHQTLSRMTKAPPARSRQSGRALPPVRAQRQPCRTQTTVRRPSCRPPHLHRKRRIARRASILPGHGAAIWASTVASRMMSAPSRPPPPIPTRTPWPLPGSRSHTRLYRPSRLAPAGPR